MINANVAAQTLGFVWLGIGVVVLIVLYATGRRPRLTGPTEGRQPVEERDDRRGALPPGPDELAYTFGGREPVRRVPPGTVLELYTEDCFGGLVRGVDDLPRSCASSRTSTR